MTREMGIGQVRRLAAREQEIRESLLGARGQLLGEAFWHSAAIDLRALLDEERAKAKFWEGWRNQEHKERHRIEDELAAVRRELLEEVDHAAWLSVKLGEIADQDGKWDDVDTYDGLHQTSVRDFAAEVLRLHCERLVRIGQGRGLPCDLQDPFA